MISKRALQNELASRVLETLRLQHIPPTETRLIQHEELKLRTEYSACSSIRINVRSSVHVVKIWVSILDAISIVQANSSLCYRWNSLLMKPRTFTTMHTTAYKLFPYRARYIQSTLFRFYLWAKEMENNINDYRVKWNQLVIRFLIPVIYDVSDHEIQNNMFLLLPVLCYLLK